MAKLAVLSLLSTASVAVVLEGAGSYILDATYTGDTFFSQLDFYTVSSIMYTWLSEADRLQGPDATNGFVK
jgi:hypothetical protein